MTDFQPLILKGSHVNLESLHEDHRAELFPLAQDETIWTYHASDAYGDRFNIWFDKALHHQKLGDQHAFAVRRLKDNKLVGSTRYYEIEPKHQHLSIGNTWYSPEVWGSLVNPESKYLLLMHAFENLAMIRVQFKTDARNARSRAAIKKLGATEEGILRRHFVLKNGYVRDSVVFSIIDEEWPRIKADLQLRLASPLKGEG